MPSPLKSPIATAQGLEPVGYVGEVAVEGAIALPQKHTYSVFTPVRHRQVGIAIPIKVTRPHDRAWLPAEYSTPSERCHRRSPAGCSPHADVIWHGQVELAVPVEVPHRHNGLFPPR